jgi:hypothetical protein
MFHFYTGNITTGWVIAYYTRSTQYSILIKTVTVDKKLLITRMKSTVWSNTIAVATWGSGFMSGLLYNTQACFTVTIH